MIAYSYKGQFRGLLAELHGLLAKNGARLDMEAANVPTIAQDDSMMADIAAIQSCADNMALPLPAAGTEPHPLTRSFAEQKAKAEAATKEAEEKLRQERLAAQARADVERQKQEIKKVIGI